MKKSDNAKCPKCGSDEFVTRPNQYNSITFANGEFQIEKTEDVDDAEEIFCRECSAEVDEEASIRDRKITLKIHK